MNRRSFIKRGALFVPTLFIPKLLRAQAYTFRDQPWMGNVRPLASFTLAWAARVVANGGTYPTAGELLAADAYYRGCVTDGIDSMILSDILVVSSSLIGATTPFFHSVGSDPWTNHSFVGGDLTINGLKGDGTSKYLDTGIITSSASPMTATNAGLAAYIHTLDTTGHGYSFGVGGVNDSSHFALYYASNIEGIYCWRFQNANTDFVQDSDSAVGSFGYRGYSAGMRTAASGSGALTLYRQNSSITPIKSVISGSSAQTGTTIATYPIVAFALNSLGSISGWIDGRNSYLGVTQGMSAAQVQKHADRVQALRVALGGGYL